MTRDEPIAGHSDHDKLLLTSRNKDKLQLFWHQPLTYDYWKQKQIVEHDLAIAGRLNELSQFRSKASIYKESLDLY